MFPKADFVFTTTRYVLFFTFAMVKKTPELQHFAFLLPSSRNCYITWYNLSWLPSTLCFRHSHPSPSLCRTRYPISSLWRHIISRLILRDLCLDVFSSSYRQATPHSLVKPPNSSFQTDPERTNLGIDH
jgi:hypothetical protein